MTAALTRVTLRAYEFELLIRALEKDRATEIECDDCESALAGLFRIVKLRDLAEATGC